MVQEKESTRWIRPALGKGAALPVPPSVAFVKSLLNLHFLYNMG